MQGSETQPVRHPWLITFGVLMGVSMLIIDSTIANIALPNMQGSLQAARDTVTWVLTSYIVAQAIGTPLAGWLAGRVGVRRLLIISVIGFTIASVLCGLATTLPQMVTFRILQGLMGAPLMPLSQTTMLDIFPRHKQPMAMSIWSVCILGFQALGPTLGGWLTEYYNWRWCFLINVPIGMGSLLLILTFMKTNTRHARRPLDFMGFISLALAVGAMQLLLDRGEQKDWFSSTEIVLYACVAGVALWTFLVHSLTTARPFVNPRLFADSNYATGLIFSFVCFLVFVGSVSLTAPMLQQLYSYPVLTASYLMLPRTAGMLVISVIMGRIVQKFDPRLFVLTGLGLLAISSFGMSGFALQMGTWPIIWTSIIQGLGVGCVMMTVTVLSYQTLPDDLRPEATALNALVRSLGQSVGVSVMISLLSTNTQTVHANLAEHLTDNMNYATVPFYNRFLFDKTQLAQALDAAVNRQAAMVAYIDDFYLMAWICLLTMPIILLVRRRPGPVAPPAPAAMAAD